MNLRFTGARQASMLRGLRRAEEVTIFQPAWSVGSVAWTVTDSAPERGGIGRQYVPPPTQGRGRWRALSNRRRLVRGRSGVGPQAARRVDPRPVDATMHTRGRCIACSVFQETHVYASVRPACRRSRLSSLKRSRQTGSLPNATQPSRPCR
jgi:hypothetical protein